MQLIDSHCHLDLLDLSDFPNGLIDIINLAEEQGVKYFLCPGVTLNDLPKQLSAIEPFKNAYTATGLHPNEITDNEPDAEQIANLINSSKNIIAIGETGLDYYRLKGKPDIQQNRFRQHIRAGHIAKRPIIIHSRQARKDTIKILIEENARDVGGIMHCFTEDIVMAKAAIDLGFYISFSGIVTFTNSGDLQDVARQIPLESMLIETDAPWLAPTPHRGKPNQPAFVRYIADHLANLRNVSLEVIADKTTANFLNLFSGLINIENNFSKKNKPEGN